jgi:hypothetical protein
LIPDAEIEIRDLTPALIPMPGPAFDPDAKIEIRDLTPVTGACTLAISPVWAILWT